MYQYLKNHCFPLLGAYFVQKRNSSVTRVNLAQAESQILASPRASPDFPPLLLSEGVTSEKVIS